MTTFEKHASVNEVSAKTALVSLAATVIGKYIITQCYMNSVLSGGSSPDEKSQNCLLCNLDKLTNKMSKLEGQVGQITKSYQMLFNEEMDVKFITSEAVNEFYPTFRGTVIEFDPEATVAKIFSEGWENASPWTTNSNSEKAWPSSSSSSSNSSKGTSSTSYPEDTPEEIKEITNIIRSTLAKAGKGNVDIKVVDVSGREGTLYGIDPNDFPDAKSFQKAVFAARKATFASTADSPESSTEKGEEYFKNATIHAVEDEAAHPETPSSSTPTDPKKLN